MFTLLLELNDICEQWRIYFELQNSPKRGFAFDGEIIITIILMIFYCGLMVHITDTGAQKVFSCTSAHITETVLAHDQHWEEQSSLSSPLKVRGAISVIFGNQVSQRLPYCKRVEV